MADITALNIFSLSLIFAALIIMFFGVALYDLILVETLYFLDLDIYFLSRLGKFSVLVYSDMFCDPFSLSLLLLLLLLSHFSCVQLCATP